MRVAYEVAKESLPMYTHRFSPKKFTQPQLFACLVLKTLMRRDYRGIAALLEDSADLRAVIDMHVAPHFTTLQKATQRLLRSQHFAKLLDATIARIMKRRRRVKTAAADSTGFDITHASRYYVWRSKRMGTPPKHLTYRHFPKLGLICNTDTHAILAAHPTRGPTPDIHQLRDLLDRLPERLSIDQFLQPPGVRA